MERGAASLPDQLSLPLVQTKDRSEPDCPYASQPRSNANITAIAVTVVMPHKMILTPVLQVRAVIAQWRQVITARTPPLSSLILLTPA